MEEYTAYCDGGYYAEKGELSIAYILELKGKVLEVFTEIIKVDNENLQPTIAEAKALGRLVNCIERKYRDKRVTVYSDSRDLVKNVNYGSMTEQHNIVGRIVDTYRGIYDKEKVKIIWTSRVNNVLVDYLTRYKYEVEKLKFTKVRLTHNFIEYKEVDAKIIYKLRFEKNGVKKQSLLLKNVDGTYTISVRGIGFSEYYSVENLKELEIKTNIMIEKSKNIMFNNNKIGCNTNIVEYINRNLI